MQKQFKTGDRIIVVDYPDGQDDYIKAGMIGTYVGGGWCYHRVKLDGSDANYDCFTDEEIKLYKPETVYQKFYKHVRKNLKLSNVEAIQAWRNTKDYYDKHRTFHFEKEVEAMIAENDPISAYFAFSQTPQGRDYWWEVTDRTMPE